MISFFSPAKVNLFLRIVSKRSDGYHNLSSVFQTISLGDTLTIEPHTEDAFTCTDHRLPIDSSNLVLKAVSLFRRKTGNKQPFKIHLMKRIPIESGLGGGSSNAATALWACNQLTKANVSQEQLKQWAGEIGSDVPFFLSQGSAYCTGRGEHVYSLPSLTARPLWIVKPSQGLSTPEIYSRLNFTGSLPENLFEKDLEIFLSGSLPYFNDLEKAAFEVKPELKILKNQLLEAGFETVLMSGSGSAFFCFGEGILPSNPDLTVFPVHFMNRNLWSWYSPPQILLSN
jgi:4-diphosphocytidyl-2-C-methyl-D-erythritol kinase